MVISLLEAEGDFHDKDTMVWSFRPPCWSGCVWKAGVSRSGLCLLEEAPQVKRGNRIP